jgi:hypothetical protein
MIAVLGVWIAARQAVIADDRLRLDTFERQYERRIAVYEATRKILEDVGNISEDDIKKYGLMMLSAEFLFDDKTLDISEGNSPEGIGIQLRQLKRRVHFVKR